MGRKKEQTKIIKPNSFIELRAALSNSETDVIDILFSMMEDGKTTFTIRAKDYQGLFLNNKGEPMSQHRIYERIQNGIKGLWKTDIRLGDDKKGVAFRILSSRAWNEERGAITVNVTQEFKKLMEEQKKKGGYTIYDLRYQFALSSEYAKRLYPMLIRYKDTGARVDAADDLRDKLGAKKEMRQSRFLNYIQKAVQEISDVTNLAVQMSLKTSSISGGKKIDAFQFEIKEQKKALPGITKEQKECLAYAKVVFEGDVKENDVLRIVIAAQYDIEKIKDAYHVMLKYQNPIKDKTAFLLAAVTGGWQKNKEGYDEIYEEIEDKMVFECAKKEGYL